MNTPFPFDEDLRVLREVVLAVDAGDKLMQVHHRTMKANDKANLVVTLYKHYRHNPGELNVNKPMDVVLNAIRLKGFVPKSAGRFAE